MDVICPLCLQPDSLSHLVQFCPDPVCAGIRNDGLDEILNLSLDSHPDSKWFVHTVINMARINPLGQLIFTGMWNSQLRNELRTCALEAGYTLSESLLRQWKLVLDDVSHSLVLISRALVAYRLAGPNPVLLPSGIAIDEQINAERNKRVGLVRARRLKRLAALVKKKQAD